jgi:hypothetical protein
MVERNDEVDSVASEDSQNRNAVASGRCDYWKIVSARGEHLREIY